MQHLQAGALDAAITDFRAAAAHDAGAQIMAAILLVQHQGQVGEAIERLEAVLAGDADFPTPLMQKYIAQANVKIDITHEVSVTVPLDGLGAALFLAECYQGQGRLSEVIGVLAELTALVEHPALTLSLCDLYAAGELWDGVLAAGDAVVISDDLTLETAILRGRALHAKGLHEAAVAVFSEALKKTKDRDPDLLNEARYWRALSYAALGKNKQAATEWQKLYAADPAFRDVAQRIGVA